jgi:hypothetical protein
MLMIKSLGFTSKLGKHVKEAEASNVSQIMIGLDKILTYSSSSGEDIVPLLHQLRSDLGFTDDTQEDPSEVLQGIFSSMDNSNMPECFGYINEQMTNFCLHCNDSRPSAGNSHYGFSTFCVPNETVLLADLLSPKETKLVDYKCDNCNTRGADVTQRTELNFVGENVAFFFKRGVYTSETGKYSKLDTSVIIQETLETVDSTLELFGIIHQHGKFEGGHYTCHIKRGSQWYDCNDHKITPLDGPDLRSGNITACFYAASAD